MTVAEKAGQLSCFNDEIRPVGAVFNPIVNRQGADALLAQVRAVRVGMLFNGYGVAGARRAQEAALRSRLGIPLAFAADVVHGCRTIFPIPLAEAAAFDPALAERAARAVAVEASAAGLHWTFAPVVDIARDQRWSRVAEGAGEDVMLNACSPRRESAASRAATFAGPTACSRLPSISSLILRCAAEWNMARSTSAMPNCAKPTCRRSRRHSPPAPRRRSHRSPASTVCRLPPASGC
jgi:beta-glucosidase